jgi:hypothetical protein
MMTHSTNAAASATPSQKMKPRLRALRWRPRLRGTAGDRESVMPGDTQQALNRAARRKRDIPQVITPASGA